MASPDINKLYQNATTSKTQTKSKTNSKKRKVTTKGNATGKPGVSAKSKTKVGNRSNTSKNVSTRAKEENKTVFNSTQDNALAVIDHYTDLGQTVNAIYKFSNTLNISDLNTALRSGISGINKVTGYLKAANDIKRTLKNGSFIDAVGALAPGAKSAMVAAGMKPDDFDKYLGMAKSAIAVGNTTKDIINGDVSIMKGLSDVSKSVFGVELGIIKDVNALIATGTALVKEFSAAGIALKDQWDALFGGDGAYGNGMFIRSNVKMEMVTNVLHSLVENGDYATAHKAIDSINPYTLEHIGVSIVESMIKNYSASAVFNKGRPESEVFADVISVINRVQNGDLLWIKREGEERRHLNLALFANASADFKAMVKVATSEPFFMMPNTTVNWLYNDTKNHALILFAVDAQLNRDFKSELNQHFNGFIVNDTVKVNVTVEPSYYNAATNKTIGQANSLISKI